MFERKENIIVPKNNQEYFNYYTVEKGDSLYGIARRYNINPELLAGLNGLSMDDYIYPNQEILVPKSGYSYYITKDGDTIDLVAGLFKISSNELLNRNGVIYLAEGQILVNKKFFLLFLKKIYEQKIDFFLMKKNGMINTKKRMITNDTTKALRIFNQTF